MTTLDPTQRQLALIDHLRQVLGMTTDDIEQITYAEGWQQPITWPLDRPSASRLIHELQRRRMEQEATNP